jgi:hypothetical protein
MSSALRRVPVCAFMGLAMVAIFGVRPSPITHAAEDQVVQDAQQTILEGRRTFRFDTFGDQQFWGDTLHLHEAVEGAKFGGVGPGLSPQTALALGLIRKRSRWRCSRTSQRAGSISPIRRRRSHCSSCRR